MSYKALLLSLIIMKLYLKSVLDYFLIIGGVVALFFFIVEPSYNELYNYISLLLGGIGLIYIVYGTSFFWRFHIIDFDWKLMNGHFLRKLICLVVLLPFFLTLVIRTANGIKGISDDEQRSLSKELIYDEKIYAKSDTIPVLIRETQESPNLLWTVYCHFIDPGSQSMAISPTGRGWAAFFAILGVFLLNGLLISIMTNWFDKRREHWSRGEIRYSRRNFKKGRYAVVIGANEIVASVIRNLLNKTDDKINFRCEGNNEYVILQTKKSALDVREELSSYLTDDELRKVVIYNALRDSKNELEKLYLDCSTEIYVLGESTLHDSGEAFHDSLNMKCVNLIAECLEKSREKEIVKGGVIHRKVCKVMFEYQTTYSIFQFSDLPDRVNDYIVFIPFNRYESWAQRVMVEGVFPRHRATLEAIQYTPLDGGGISPTSDEYVHFVVVGMSKMGIAMGIQAALQAHYLNSYKRRSRITFIDTNADKEMAFFKGRYENLFALTRHKYVDANEAPLSLISLNEGWTDPAEQEGYHWKHLSSDGKNFIDLELEFIKGEIESDNVRNYLREISKDKKSKLTIAVCLTQTHQAVAASLYFPVEVYKKVQEIWVYQREAEDIVSNLINTTQMDKRYKKLRPFGMLHGEYMRDRSLYLKALLANGAYQLNDKKYHIVERDMADKNTYADLRELWRNLIIANKWSNKFFVDSIYGKVRGILPELIQDGMVSGSYKDKLFDSEKCSEWIDRLIYALKKYEHELAVCEHNRWNVQQLLMEYWPCEKKDDRVFQVLNNQYKQVTGTLGITSESDPKYNELKVRKNVVKAEFDRIKKQCKTSEYRIHPNLCSYEHLDNVDSEAKNYDKYLNNSIPALLILVDGYKHPELKKKLVDTRISSKR